MKKQAHIDWYSVNEKLLYKYIVSMYDRHSDGYTSLDREIMAEF